MKNNRKLNKKKIKELFILLVLLIVIVLLSQSIRNALSRYQSDINSDLNDLDVAFCVLQNDYQSKNIILDDIYPKTTPFEFPFSVSNFEEHIINNETNQTEKNISEVSFELDLIIKATTNMPLNYKLFDGETELNLVQKVEKENGVYIKTLTAYYSSNQDELFLQYGSDVTKNFILKVEFPLVTDKIVNNTLVTDSLTSDEFADLVDNVTVSVVSRQKK